MGSYGFIMLIGLHTNFAVLKVSILKYLILNTIYAILYLFSLWLCLVRRLSLSVTSWPVPGSAVLGDRTRRL